MPGIRTYAMAGLGGTLLAGCLILPGLAHAAPQEAVLHSFAADEGKAADGVLVGRGGVLYGTLAKGGRLGGGGVYALTPPAPPSVTWQYRTIYSFPSTGTALAAHGGMPDAQLIQDRQGRLLGTTDAGGRLGGGIAFMLTLPATPSSDWIETTLHSFAEGEINKSGVVAGPQGAVFGSVGTVVDIPLSYYGFGYAYRLAPPSSGKGEWHFTFLGEGGFGDPGPWFNRPFVQTDATGHPIVYLTTNAPDVIRFTEPAAGGGPWDRTILMNGPLDPTGAEGTVVGDRGSNLYGFLPPDASAPATPASGIFRLSPPPPGKTGWQFLLLSTLPVGRSVVEDSHGVLFGAGLATFGIGCGAAYSLTPVSYGGNQTPWNRRLLHSFAGGEDGCIPSEHLAIAGDAGTRTVVFGTTSGGGQHGQGTIFSITP